MATDEATGIQVEGGKGIEGPVKILFITPVETQEEHMYGQTY